MAIEKANKLRNVTNVAKELLKDPTQTEREIANKLGIDRSTVNRAKSELHEITPKEQRLSQLLETDLEIEELAQAEIKRRLSESPGDMNGNDIKGFSELSMKRRAVFGQKKDDGADREIIVQI